MKKVFKSKKGITLVALIITVIVMLILVGVAISVVVDGEGLFGRTRNAAEQYEEAAANENKQLASLIDEIDRYLAGAGNDSGEVEGAEDTIAPETAIIEVNNIGGTTFTLVATGADAQSEVAKYEFYINGSVEGTVETTSGTAELDVSGKDEGTTYNCYVKVYDAANNDKDSETITVTTEVEPLTVGVLNTGKNKTYDGNLTGTYNNPIIPKGFAAINENGAIWGDTVNGYKYGLVITDSVDASGNSNGNEFVWVPVDGINVKFGKQAWYKADGTTEYVSTTIGTAANCLETLPIELTPNANGEIPNGGFYIARYEAGIAEGMTAPSGDTTADYGDGDYRPVSKQGATVWNYIKWGTSNSDSTPGNGAVTVAKSMYSSTDSNYGAISTLIYGAQWDTALKFIQTYDIGETGYATYATNSVGYGNYSGEDDKGDTFESTTVPTSCGAASQFRQKNIYDMAGNVYEWTMEAYNTYCVRRGGSYDVSSSSHPASSRGAGVFSSTVPTVGFRVALYVK